MPTGVPSSAAIDTAVPRVDRLGRERFRTEYLVPRRPVVMTGIMTDSPALAWTPAYLRARFPDVKLTLADGAALSVADYVDAIERPDLDFASAPSIFRFGFVAEVFPELAGKFVIPDHFQPNWFDSRLLRPFVPKLWRKWVEILIGPRGGRFPSVHYDRQSTFAWSFQVHGTKTFWIWPPSYDRPETDFIVKVDVRSNDWNERLDGLFSHAKPLKTTLRSGDLMFIPPRWWHTTEIGDTSVTLSGNFLNEVNWADWCRSTRAIARDAAARKRFFDGPFDTLRMVAATAPFIPHAMRRSLGANGAARA